VEGGRLAALARGEPVPPPFQDPDVVSAVSTVLAAEAAIAGFQLGEGEGGTDLTVVLRVAGGGTGRKAAELGGRAATAIMSVLGGRLRRGITVMIARS
jgi:hypothetical protein